MGGGKEGEGGGEGNNKNHNNSPVNQKRINIPQGEYTWHKNKMHVIHTRHVEEGNI